MTESELSATSLVGEDAFANGISFLELLILFQQWAGHRLLSEKVTRPHVRANRLFNFPLFLCQRELKFGMVASSLVA